MSRQLRAQILKGYLKAGANLPSIRTMAKDHRVSVITVQRAYDDLEREGLLVSRRGKGFFAAELPAEDLQKKARKRATEALTKVVRDALADGLTPKQVRATLNAILKEGEHEQ